MNAAARNPDTECVTEKRCRERHAVTTWLFGFLAIFFVLMLGGAGVAIQTASEANARAAQSEARLDSLERHIKDRLDDIWSHNRESAHQPPAAP